MKIAEKLQPSEERLFSPKEQSKIIAESPSFAPQIDPISVEIEKRSKEGKEEEHMERWEKLYKQGEQKKAELEQRRQQSKEEQSIKEQCSFHPQLVSMEIEGKPIQLPDSIARKTLIERSEAWQKSKEGKIKKREEEEASKKLDGCTFKPQLVSLQKDKINNSVNLPPDQNPSSLKTVEKYIEKQKNIRKTKEEAKKKANQIVGSGNVWKKKVTVPKGPNCMSNKKSPNQQIERIVWC